VNTDDLTAMAENSEAEALFAMMTSMTDKGRRRMDVSTTRIGGGVVVRAGNDSTGFWSRVLGLGVNEPITDQIIDEVIAYHRERGDTGPRLQIAPTVLPSDWARTCARHGLNQGPSWYKLVCPVDAFVPGTTSLRIGPVGPDQAEEAGAVLARGFGWEQEDVVDVYAPAVSSGAVQGLAAWDGDTMVAAAGLGLHAAAAEMYGAATLPEHRGRGAQSALLTARAQAAAEAGCTWLVAETWVPPEGATNPSLDNMRRAGFRVLYERASWR